MFVSNMGKKLQKRSDIKFKIVDNNLPMNNPLRTYLSEKPESGTNPAKKKNPNLVPLKYSYPSNPKVLLINPPLCIPPGQIKRCIPPMGITYIGAYLRSVGIQVQLLDCIIEGWGNEELINSENNIYSYGLPPKAIERYLLNEKPDIIGLSHTFSQDIIHIYRIARIVKRCLPHSIVVVGGLHPTIYPRETLEGSFENGKPSIDFILRGEGEKRLAYFVKCAGRGMVDKNADGLVGFFNGEYVSNPEIEKIEDLDKLPFPAYDLLPLEKYFEIHVPSNPFPIGKRVMAIYTHRGCPIGCTFCSSTNLNKKFRARSAQNVYEEIKYYIEKYGVDEIQFADDNLTLNYKRAMEIFEKITPLNIKWCTPNGTMVNSWKPEISEAAVRSGLYQVTLAVDGVSRASHNLTRKPVKLAVLPEKIKFFRELGTLVHAFVMVGIPGETKDQLLEGLEFLKTLDFTSISVFMAQPYPGSELYETELNKGNIIKEDGFIVNKSRSNFKKMLINTDELEKIIHEFTMEFEKINKSHNPELWKNRYEPQLKRFEKSELQLIIGKGTRSDVLFEAWKLT